jgi:Skp family chaperone for outer membrane proteins
MKRLFVIASLAASAVLPSAAHAQAIPPAVIAVVDLEKVTSECNACKTAQAALVGQVNGLKSRQQALATPLQTEQKSIQAAIDALNGKEPDATLQARVRAFQAKQAQAEQELGTQQQQIQRNQQYVQKQIADKLGPIYSQVMQRRGANVMVEIGQTLASGATLDVTNDVLTALNTSMPSIATTAPAQAAPARPKQPQGR